MVILDDRRALFSFALGGGLAGCWAGGADGSSGAGLAGASGSEGGEPGRRRFRPGEPGNDAPIGLENSTPSIDPCGGRGGVSKAGVVALRDRPDRD